MVREGSSASREEMSPEAGSLGEEHSRQSKDSCEGPEAGTGLGLELRGGSEKASMTGGA